MLIFYVVLLPKFCKNFSIPEHLSPFSVITINPDTKDNHVNYSRITFTAPIILHDNLQRESHKPDGPSTSVM
jgi:hypothetical protein